MPTPKSDEDDESISVPDGAYQYLLEMAAQANAPKRAHDLAEQLLAHLETTIQRAKQKIRVLEQENEELKAELEDASKE